MIRIQLQKKIHAGEEALGPKIKFLGPAIVILMILLTIISLTPKYLFAFSEESCDFFYPTDVAMNPFSSLADSLEAIGKNNDCKRKVKKGETLFSKGVSLSIVDEQCENEPRPLKERCYFKKAVDSSNVGYCYSTTSEELCAKSLAIALGDKSICQHAIYVKGCEEDVETCKNNAEEASPNQCKTFWTFSCDGMTSLSEKPYYEECLEKYS